MWASEIGYVRYSARHEAGGCRCCIHGMPCLVQGNRLTSHLAGLPMQRDRYDLQSQSLWWELLRFLWRFLSIETELETL